MTIGPDVSPSRRRKNRRTSGAQQAQWQFQADLLDQLSDAVIAVDLDERITYLNRAAVAQYRVDPVGAIGQPLSHAYRYEWLQPEDELLAEAALAQQGHWRGENRHIRRDGSALHVESLVTMLRDEAGNATGLLATIRDITDRKQMERELRASERRYRRLADTLPQLVWSADVAGVTDYYNIHIHDFDPSVWQGTKGFDWESLLHPDDLAPTLAAWQEAVTQRRSYSCEHRLRMADGSWRWHLSRAVLMQDPENGLRWYGTATDIHERKTAEEALRVSEERYRTLFETMDEGFCVFEMLYNEADEPVDYRFLEVNPSFARFTGLENAVGKTAYELVPNLEPQWVAIYDAVARTGEARHFIEGSAAMGRWFDVHAFRFGGPESRRVALLFTNITERKQTALNQQFLLSLNSTLRTLTDADAIQQTVVKQVGEYLGVDRCRFNAIDLAADKATLLAAWSRPGLPPPSDITRLSDHAPAAYIDSAKAGRTLVVHDVAQDEGDETTKALLLARGYAATLRVPCLREGQWVASLHVLQTTPRQWRADEVQLVENVVHHFWPIVEKARIEAELRRQEEFLRRLADNVPGLVGYLGADERYHFVNAAFEAWFQRPRQQIIGQTVAALIGEADQQRLADYRQQALAGERVSYETAFAYPDGVTRTVWGRYQPDVAADGRILGFYLFLMDITERQQAEADARFLADLAETIRLAGDAKTLIADAVTLVGDYLHLGCALWIEVEPAQDRGVVRYQHCRGQELTAVEFRLSAYSDATRSTMAAGLPLVIDDTATDPHTADRHATLYAPCGVGALVNVPFLHEGAWRSLLSATVAAPRQWQPREVRLLETVAERIWLALEKLRAEAALRASEARFRTVQQATPDGYMIFESVRDEQGVITDFRWLYVNPASEQMIGRTAQDLQGKCLLVEMPGNRAEGLFDAYCKVVETGAVYQREFCYQHDGIDRWFRNTAAKAGDGFAVAFSDVTARKAAEADQQFLAELAEQIRLADDADDLIASTVGLLGDHLRVGRCAWIEVEPAHDRLWVRAQHCCDLPLLPRESSLALYSPTTTAELQAGRTLIVENTATDTRTAPFYAARYGALQAGAFASAPFLHNGAWHGVLTIMNATPHTWQARELGLLETVAERLWLAVEKLRLHAEVRSANERFTLAEAAVPGWIYDYDWRTGVVTRSDGFYRVLGYAPEECQSTAAWWQSLIHPDDWQWLAGATRPHTPSGDLRLLEYRVRDRNGQYHHIWDRARIMRDESGAIIRLVGSSVDISERKTLEEALRRNEARYRTIFDHAGVSLWEEDFSQVKRTVDELTAAWRAAGVTDLAAAMRSHCAAHPDFVLAMLDRVRILNVNEETVRLYGRPKAELLRPFAHHFDAETVTRFVDQLALLASGQQRYRFDGPITTPQGETRHIAFTVVFPADADGDFTRVLLSGLDVTPLKAAEVENRRLFLETQSLLAQVQEGERFLQSIADTIPNVIYLFDLRTMCNRYANRHLAVTLGYTAAEAQALGDQFIPGLIHPDDQRYLADHLTRLYALADGEMADWEYRMQDKGGEWRWLSSREIVFERDEQGCPVVILGALQDSTARKEAEVALRASEARFRHLAEAMPQVVWTCQADGSLTYINQQWSEYSGITLAVTLAEGMWPAMHPADHAANREQWRQALTSGEAYEGEVRLRRQDGAYRWFLERAIPVQDEAGAIQQWFGVSMEIHDRKEAEQRQAELVALLEALLANAPVGFAFLDRGQHFVRINKMLAEQHGRAIADHIGRPFAEIAPSAAQSVGPILEQVFVTGAGIYNREISGPKVANPNEIVHALASWFPVVVNGVTQYVGSMVVDITERKRQERHQQFLSELGLDLRLLSDTATILSQVVNRLGDYLQVAGCRINEVDQQRAQFTLLKDWVTADAPWPIVATPGVYPLTELAPPTLLAALQAGQTVAVANTLNDPQTAPVASNYEDDQVHSLIGVPIFHQGEWRATLSVKGYGERQWRPDEVTLVEAVASQLSALLEKVRAEEALRASEERLRLALAGGGMGIWESQIATNRSLWSAEEYALFGLAPDVEITNELFNRLVHPDDLPGLQAALTHLIAAGSDHTGEFRVLRPDGAVRWLADRVTVIRDEAGQPVRLLGINFDITERKEREAMIRQQLAEIEAIYATAPVGLCLVDRDLRYVRINETLATINGSTIVGQLGRTLAETQPAEGYQLVEPLYRGVIETGIPLLNREVHESYVDPAQARDWLASYYPLKNADGVVTGVNAVILEITERKRHERQLQELNASLEERVLERTKALAQANHALSITNRELEQFTYAAAHDLRTPLRGIANLVQWIREDATPVLSPESQRHLDKLGGRVKRLEKMLEDMLAYSRVGRVRYQPETVDVQQLVQSLLDLLAPPTGFAVKATTHLPTFTALRVPLELVFRNLLSNTIRHHHDPANGQAEISVRKLDDWYEFCISDNGPGIDPQYHERIFGMFQTLKPRDQVEGSGIGLALVKKTVESMGGQIRMESVLGQGTSFYFTWPKG